MKKFKLLLIVLFLLGCSNNKNLMSKYGFESTQELSFNLIDLNDSIYLPRWVEIFDSLLLVYDPIDKYNYAIFNINTQSLVIRGGEKGEGPDDIMYGQFVDKINDKEFQVSDLTNRKILIYNIDSIISNNTFKPIKKVFYSQYEMKSKESLEIMYYLNDSINIGIGPFNSGKYAFIKNNEVNYVGKYPDELITQGHPFYVHQGVFQINDERDIILYHSPLGLYYEIYACDNGEFNKINGEYVLTEFVNDCSTENTIKGINSADFAKNEIFLLFSGKTDKEYSNAVFADNILVCDIDGTKKRSYKTDRNNICIGVDSLNRRIYCVAQNPENYEFEVGYYKY